MGKKGIGLTMVILGVGSFILPFFGLQFRIMNLFGNVQWIVAIIIALIGALLLLFGKDQNTS